MTATYPDPKALGHSYVLISQPPTDLAEPANINLNRTLAPIGSLICSTIMISKIFTLGSRALLNS